MPPFFRRAPHTLPLALCAALLVPATARSAPTWETFVPADAQVVGRVGGALVPLPDGSTLLIGGLTHVSSPQDKDVPTGSVVRITPGAVSPQTPLRALKPLLHERRGHTATLLPDGRVLVVGGVDAGGNALASVEIGTAEGNDFSWKEITPLGGARSFHTATVLTNGRVLVVGGRTDLGADLGTAESFDPFAKNSEGKWNGVASLPAGQERSFHTATLLPDGRVLVAGGAQGNSPQNSSWLLDPKAPTGNPWKNKLSLLRPRAGHQAVLMPSGQVLLVGGCEQAPLDAKGCIRPGRDEFFTSGDTDSWALLDVPPPAYELSPGTSPLIFGQSVAGMRNGWVLAAFGRVLDGSLPVDLKSVFTLRPASADPKLDPIGPIAQPLPGTWHWAPSTEAPQLPVPGASSFHSHALAVTDATGSVVMAGGRQQDDLVDSVDYLRFLPDGVACTHDDGGLECAGGVCLCGTADCATGTCETPLPDGSLCTQGDDCTSRSCEPTVDQAALVCCAFSCADKCATDLTGLMVGTCGATACNAQYRSCQGFRCQGDACLASCTSNDQCVTNYFCQNPGPSGACVAVKNKGTACGDDTQCDSKHCVDGVCCDTSCTGFCDSCVAAQTGQPDGTCASKFVGEPPRDSLHCVPSAADICGNTGTCNGKGDCAKTTAGTPCDQDDPLERDGYACAGQDRQSAHLTCDGQGECKTELTDCQSYVCDRTTSQCAIRCNPADTNPSSGKNELCAEGFLCGGTTGQCGENSVCLSATQYIVTSGGSTIIRPCQHNRPCLAADPLACENGCTSSLDCAPGTFCRQNGDCTAPVSPSGDDPDCFCAQPGPARPSTPGLLVTLLAASTLAARRRLSRRAARASR